VEAYQGGNPPERGQQGERPGLPGRLGRSLFWMAQAGLLCLGLWGCGTVAETPASQPEASKPAPAAEQAMAGPVIPNSFEDLKSLDDVKRFMTPHRQKLAIVGGVALLLTFLIGVGVGRRHNVEPPPSQPAQV